MTATTKPATPRTLSLNPKDNVIVAVDAVLAGVTARGVTAALRIPKGHKMAAAKIAKGQPIPSPRRLRFDGERVRVRGDRLLSRPQPKQPGG